MLPLDELTADCVEYLKSLGSQATLVSEVVSTKDPIVQKALFDGKI